MENATFRKWLADQGVPVLSVHNMFMAPKFWIELRRV
jgi:hypothetical protein